MSQVSTFHTYPITINKKEVNALFGVKPGKGSDYFEDSNFDGKNYPFFSEAIELIEKNLNSNKNSRCVERFFELQMNYMLLWSAIDRYSSLKYNEESKGKNNQEFAKETAFKEGMKRYEDEYHQRVLSTEELKMRKFNVRDPYGTLLYYYTFRCNVVHRGKSEKSDYSMFRQATEELLEIFKDVLKDTFDD